MKPSYLKLSLITLICLVIANSVSVKAEIEKPARKIEEVDTGSKVTHVKKIPGARVVVADYVLLKKDFPQLVGKSNDEIDTWLLSKTALLSETQLGQTAVNSEIVSEPAIQTAFRPHQYNRALVFKVDGGLIDGKGFGATKPLQQDHSNGLATLGEVLREYLYQKLVQKIFNFEGVSLTTVGSYAVLDWGFREKHADGSTSEAGAILRQAHRRYQSPSSLLDDRQTLEVELILRKYGITTAGAYRFKAIEQLNVQGTIEGEIIDFGGYLAVERFSKPSQAFLGGPALISPDSKNFPQPNPKMRIPFQMWGTTVSGREDPKTDNPWIWSHELAEAFAAGRAHRRDVEKHFRNFMDPVDRILRSWGQGQCSGVFR